MNDSTAASTSTATSNVFICNVCKKTFSANYNLRKHIKKFHTVQSANLLAAKSATVNARNYKFPCEDCHLNFNYRHHLTLHQKTKHGLVKLAQLSQLDNRKKCPLCSYTNRLRKELILHFTRDHDITIDTKIMKFESKEEFNTWLSLTEKNTKSKFVKEGGPASSKHHVTSQLICHRSGYFISRGKGLRNLKTHGSNKIGAFCPAGVTLTERRDGKCKIEYVDVHVGHENDLGHLFLTSVERKSLASKIAAKISFEAILDEVRDSISHSSLERLHLLTKKYLYNVEANYNLHSAAAKRRSEASIDESTTVLVEQSKGSYHQGNADNLTIRKEKMKKTVLDLIEGITNNEQMDAFQRFITAIAPTLSALGRTESKKQNQQYCTN